MKPIGIVASLIFLVSSPTVFGQADQSANFTPPMAIYHGSELDAVSLPTRNVHVSIPLVHLKGRGLDFDVNATFNTQSWSTAQIYDPVTDIRDFITFPGVSGGWSVGPARMGGVSSQNWKCVLQSTDGSGTCLRWGIYADFMTSQGSTIELGDDTGVYGTGPVPTRYWSNDATYMTIPSFTVVSDQKSTRL